MIPGKPADKSPTQFAPNVVALQAERSRTRSKGAKGQFIWFFRS